MDDQEILKQIRQLIDDERGLRDQVARGESPKPDERIRLQRIEESLDQCWDLLRQRRALREVGGEPDQARVRPVDEVEDYLQ